VPCLLAGEVRGGGWLSQSDSCQVVGRSFRHENKAGDEPYEFVGAAATECGRIGRSGGGGMEGELKKLKEKWLASGLFIDEHEYLLEKIRVGEADFVSLDQDGTAGAWLAVVVRRETGVVYGNQCAGVSCLQWRVEGYLVPLSGWKREDGGKIDFDLLNGVFHEGDTCRYDWTGRNLPVERLEKLNELIGELSYWRSSSRHPDKYAIHVDMDRIDEIAEAWIPVETPDGPGVLIYENCD
jgi:hypothetical protein